MWFSLEQLLVLVGYSLMVSNFPNKVWYRLEFTSYPIYCLLAKLVTVNEYPTRTSPQRKNDHTAG